MVEALPSAEKVRKGVFFLEVYYVMTAREVRQLSLDGLRREAAMDMAENKTHGCLALFHNSSALFRLLK